MNRTFLIAFTAILTFFSFTLNFAQVGIGTENPEGVLHIDAKQNNDNSTDDSKYDDDIIITEEGKIGVRTKNPEGLLHVDRLSNNDDPALATDDSRFDDDFIVYEDGVKMGIKNPKGRIMSPFLRIVNGTEGEGKILTSDEEGNATWEDYGRDIIKGVISPSSINLNLTMDLLGAQITLPPGAWILKVNIPAAIVVDGSGEKTYTKTNSNVSNFFASASFVVADDYSHSTPNVYGTPDVYGAWESGNLMDTYFMFFENKNQISGKYSFPNTSSIAYIRGEIIINNTSGEDKTYFLEGYGKNMSPTLSTYTNSGADLKFETYPYDERSFFYAERVYLEE